MVCFFLKKGHSWGWVLLILVSSPQDSPFMWQRKLFAFKRRLSLRVSENVQIREEGFFMIPNKVWNEVETCCKNLQNFCVIMGLSSCFKRQYGHFRGWVTGTSLSWNVSRKAVINILIMQDEVWSIYSVVKTVLKHSSSLLSDFTQEQWLCQYINHYSVISTPWFSSEEICSQHIPITLSGMYVLHLAYSVFTFKNKIISFIYNIYTHTFRKILLKPRLLRSQVKAYLPTTFTYRKIQGKFALRYSFLTFWENY